eukprot:TRINITY_DN19117_c0_g1_i5.p1 TRINITY_DN19117_c0_g1~~TRINITY_DN19117_c0_g1_i5.p1  ORF type:complete len:554 (+),score=98.88 TRINITY_DN19117_c0_g1_i5:125-1786(+)
MGKRGRQAAEDEHDEDLDDASDEAGASEVYAWHFDMLHDRHRLEAFEKAFERLPAGFLSEYTAPALDIGSGSGILGLGLLKKQPKVPFVHGFESDARLAAVANENAVKNGLGRRMRVHPMRSTSVPSLAALPGGRLDKGSAASSSSSRAGLVVCEILDAGLLGEDCIGTLRHASKHLLAPGYRAIPASAEVYACGVESELLASWQHMQPAAGRGRGLRLPVPAAYAADPGCANPHDVVLDRLVAAGAARVLTNEFHATDVDFENLPPRGGQKATLDVTASTAGRLDAIAFWWRCKMVREDTSWEHALSNAPSWAPSAKACGSNRGEIDHWRQAVCVLPRPSRQLKRGERIRIAAMHDDEDIWFRLLDDTEQLPPSTTKVPQALTPLSLWSPTRLWHLANLERLERLQQAVQEAASRLPVHAWEEDAGAVVLDISDAPFLALAAWRGLEGSMASSKRRRRAESAAASPKSRPPASCLLVGKHGGGLRARPGLLCGRSAGQRASAENLSGSEATADAWHSFLAPSQRRRPLCGALQQRVRGRLLRRADVAALGAG